MKNQETDSLNTTLQITANETTQLESSQATLNQENPNEKKGIYCKMSKISTHACMNNNCKEYAFVCEAEECKCQEEHQNCFFTKNSKFINWIKRKIVPIKTLEDAINQVVDKMIDDLSDFRDKILVEMKEIFKYCGLNSDQITILNSVDTGNVQKLTGAEISKAQMSKKNDLEILQDMQVIAKSIKQNMLHEKVLTQISTQIHDFHAFQTNFCNDNQLQTLPHKLVKAVKPFENIISSSFLENSKIIKQLSQCAILHEFFKPQILEISLSLLYRASQNDFSTDKFHNQCDLIENTLTLCQTTAGKIIGGYSTRAWGIFKPRQSNNTQAVYCKDQSGDSFIFSLTHKDKFKLRDDKKSISKWKKQAKVGPSFGGKDDLVIRDKANENFNSSIKLNGSYLNQNYNLGDGKVNNERFIGQSSQNETGKDNRFSLKEWQVWQIQFL